MADCFALALAEEERATLLTTDSELAKVKETKPTSLSCNNHCAISSAYLGSNLGLLAD
ncbi:MAG: hypothetical protein QW231_00100 [Candidatus Bathyarchaeia archaeon]